MEGVTYGRVALLRGQHRLALTVEFHGQHDCKSLPRVVPRHDEEKARPVHQTQRRPRYQRPRENPAAFEWMSGCLESCVVDAVVSDSERQQVT